MLNRRRWPSLVCLLILSAVAIYIWSPPWRSYPAITHPEADQLLRQLYTAGSSRDLERLSVTRQRFNKLLTDNAITAAEQAAFEKIFQRAESHSWDSAARECLRFAENQIGRVLPLKNRR